MGDEQMKVVKDHEDMKTTDSVNISLKVPTLTEVGELVRVMDQHPFGSAMCIAFFLVVAVCIAAWRFSGG